MMLGLSLANFTLLHVIISLIAIVAGFVVVFAMANNGHSPTWVALFLATTILTSVTGFMFPPKPIGPPLIFGIISLMALALALVALYGRALAGSWRGIYIGTSLLSLYLNVVVLVVQSFQKIPLLNPLAPTQTEPPFLVTQLLVLALFIWLTVRAFKRFRPSVLRPAM